MGIKRIESSERGKRKDSKASIGVVSARGCRVNGLGIRLCG